MLHISHSCDAPGRRSIGTSLSDTAAPRGSHRYVMTAQWTIIVGLIRQSTHKRPVGCDLALSRYVMIVLVVGLSLKMLLVRDATIVR